MTEQLTAARALRAQIDENARTAAGGPVGESTVKALKEAGLWGVMTPKAVGGAELSLAELVDVFAEVSRADGSSGWCLMAGAASAAYFGAYLEDAAVKALFADGVPLMAGQFAPNGQAVREGDGFRLTGRYQFGSGIHYAEKVGAGFLVLPPEGSDAPAEYRFGFVSKDQVELLGNWDVLGLGSTASLDYAIDDVLVPESSTFLFATPTRHRGGPVYELGVIALTAIGHAGFAIGVGRRAIDELMAIAKTKVRMGAASYLKDSEAFLLGLGKLESRLISASAWVRECVHTIEAEVVRSGTVDPVRNNQLRQATVFVTQEAADIAREAYLMAGTSGLREGPLQRCFRDIHAGSQHFFASPASTLDMARDMMASAPDAGVEAELG